MRNWKRWLKRGASIAATKRWPEESHYTGLPGGRVISDARPRARTTRRPDESPLRQHAEGNNLRRDAKHSAQRRENGLDDWCVSVFKDNAGIVKFDDQYNVVFKVETHNHPSALEPYGGANTGIGGVIRDPLGTGLGAKPVANTDIFCFAPPDTPADELPPGVLHPRRVMKGVVAGVRDYGNRIGIPTVNGAIYFDPRYLGNPLVLLRQRGSVAGRQIEQRAEARRLDCGHWRPHRSRWHSRRHVQFGRAYQRKRIALRRRGANRQRHYRKNGARCRARSPRSRLVQRHYRLRCRRIFQRRWRNGRGSIGAVVWLDRAPLKYSGLSYTEIWISEAQERMVLAVPPKNWPHLESLCRSEGVEATVIGEFRPTGKLQLFYHDQRSRNCRWTSCTTADRRWCGKRRTLHRRSPLLSPAEAAAPVSGR